ncbi:SS18 family [Phytophthora cactorum]|nr:SS18 family [Phytophthora cactorum]
MPNSSSSDAETVLGEDSPLSPCVWIHSATVEEWRQSPVQETAEISSEACSAQASEPRQGETDFRLQNTRRELQLSPASQLNVLSQISELADAQSRQQEARPEALQPNKPTQRTHMWAPVVETAKRKKNARTAASTTRPKAKKQKTTQKKPSHSQAERLAADMVDWETGGLFTVDSSEEEDQWVYDDIIDNDFEASGLRWTASPAAAADDEDSGSASSISDVFADMLTVNEDLIVATAESQAEGDVDGLIAYQRILHRDLMEMAEFIDSMFGVYSNTNSNNTSLTPISTVLIPPVTCCMSEKKSDESELPVVVDLTTEAADGQEPAPTVEKTTAVKKKAAKKKAQRGALLTAIEAGEKVRETQRQRSNGSSRDIRCSKRKASVPS